MMSSPSSPHPQQTQLIDYVFHNYRRLFNRDEKLAYQYIIVSAKAKHSSNPNSHLHKRQQQLRIENPGIAILLKDGERAFFAAVTERLLRDCADQIVINRCPKCLTLCRTPTACLCPNPACNHTWYETRQAD